MTPPLRQALRAQYNAHKSWSASFHHERSKTRPWCTIFCSGRRRRRCALSPPTPSTSVRYHPLPPPAFAPEHVHQYLIQHGGAATTIEKDRQVAPAA
jgi:hypothetical protein